VLSVFVFRDLSVTEYQTETEEEISTHIAALFFPDIQRRF